MIVDIPTSSDFFDSATDLLHSAWDQVAGLLVEFDEIGDFAYEALDEEFDDSDYEQYWKAAKQVLTTSFTMVQQGVEFFIKGRIASVSPYLLLAGNPSVWPKKCDKEDMSFSFFRAIDAQDLVKLHDTVFNERFSDQFRTWYEEMRASRNKIMHTVDKKVSLNPESVFATILYAHEYFCGEKNWVRSRFEYLDKTPTNSMRYIRQHEGHKPYVLLQVHTELGVIVGKLQPSKVDRYFGFQKRRKSYNCPSCYEVLTDLDYFEPGYHNEYFKPYQRINENAFFCCVCSYFGTISGERCIEENCDSKLVDNEKGLCLVCGAG